MAPPGPRMEAIDIHPLCHKETRHGELHRVGEVHGGSRAASSAEQSTKARREPQPLDIPKPVGRVKQLRTAQTFRVAGNKDRAPCHSAAIVASALIIGSGPQPTRCWMGPCDFKRSV